MTATVGATLTTTDVFPPRHAGLGPYQSAAGDYYTFLLFGTGLGNVRPYFGSSPMTSMASTASKVMSSAGSTAIEALACFQVGDNIHIAAQIATGAVYYNYFTMGTGWGLSSSELAVAAATQAPVAGTTFVDLVVRSGGEVVIVYNAGQTAMSSTFNMVRHRRRTGVNTYQTAVNVDNGGSINWTGPVAALGASDRVHFFFADRTNGRHYQRTLSAANALQTFPSPVDSQFGTGADYMNAISYVDGATTRVRTQVSTTVAAASRSAVIRLDSADAPTVAISGAVADRAPGAINNQGVVPIVNDGTTLYALHRDNTAGSQKLYSDTSTDGGSTWGTDTLEYNSVINNLTTNVYNRSGNKLAMVVDESGTIKYAEIALGAASTPISLAATSTASALLGRSPTRKFASTGTSVPVLLRSPTRSLSSTSTGVGALSRNVPRSLPSVSTGAPVLASSKSVVRSLAAASVAAAAMLRSPGMSLKATSVSTGLLARAPTRALGATSTAAPSILRSPTRFVAATSTGVAAMAVATAVQRTLSATSTAVAALRRTLNVSLPTTGTSTPSLVRSPSLRLAATSTSTATLARSVGRKLGVTSIGVALLSAIKSVQRVLTATSTAVTALRRSPAFVLRSSSTASPSLMRRVSLALRISSTGVAAVYRGLIRRLAATSTGAATVAFARALSRSLAATSSVIARLQRSPSRTFAALSSGAALLRRSAFLKLEATTEASVSLLRGTTVNLQAYVSGLAEIIREEITTHADASIYRLFRVLSENRFFRVLFENRLNDLLLEDRTYEVSSESRDEDIDTEVRSQGVDLENRNQNVEP